MAGEYEYHRTGPVRIRDLSKPIVIGAANHSLGATGPGGPQV
jgi:hypothetical protein